MPKDQARARAPTPTFTDQEFISLEIVLHVSFAGEGVS